MGNWEYLPLEMKRQIVEEIVVNGGTWHLADKHLLALYQSYEKYKKFIYLNFNLSYPFKDIDRLMKNPNKPGKCARDSILNMLN